MPSSPTDLVALLAGIHENPNDRAGWLVTADALREEGQDQLADCFEHIGRKAFANIVGVFRSCSEFRKPLEELLVKCNEKRYVRIVEIEEAMKHFKSCLQKEKNLLIDYHGGATGSGFHTPVSTAISGGVIALPGGYWLVALYVDVMRATGNAPPLPNGWPNRTVRCYRQRDGLGFVKYCLAVHRPKAKKA